MLYGGQIPRSCTSAQKYICRLYGRQLRRIPIKSFEWTNSIIWFWSSKGNGLLDIFHREQSVCVCPNLGQHGFLVSSSNIVYNIYLFYYIKLSDQALPKFSFYNGSPQKLLQTFMTLWKGFFISTKSDNSRQHLISWSNVGQSFVTCIHWFAKLSCTIRTSDRYLVL